MAAFDGFDLKKWRKEQGVTAAHLASQVACDESTIFHYESGKLHPNPDVMYQICRELGDTRRWQDWMRTEYPASYGREHPEPVKFGLQGSIMMLYAEIQDLEALELEAMRDGADGIIDCTELRRDLLREVTELIQAAQSARAILEAGINGTID